jgi:hypothetical protein
MKTITADLTKGTLLVNGAVFSITCNVRSLANKKRRKDEVIRSIPGNYPYDPRPFPKGKWNITGIEWQEKEKFDARVYGPVKIRTDACQWVKIWELDKDGDYLRERGDEVQDYGYLLHFSLSSTTLGCIRFASANDAVLVANIIQRLFDQGETVQIEVI